MEVLEMSYYRPKVTERVSGELGFELDALAPRPANVNCDRISQLFCFPLSMYSSVFVYIESNYFLYLCPSKAVGISTKMSGQWALKFKS